MKGDHTMKNTNMNINTNTTNTNDINMNNTDTNMTNKNNGKKFFNTKTVVAAIMIGVVAIGTGMTIHFCTSANAEESAKPLPTQATVATIAPTQKATVKATEAPTQKPTQKATEKATQKATQKATKKATEKATQKAAKKATQKATEKPAQKPTQKPTAAPTQAPTAAPTAAPTVKATVAPTAAPTQKPTEAPTVAPTEAPSETPVMKSTAVSAEASAETPTEGEHTELYKAIKDVIKDNKATSYQVVTVKGSDNKMLVLSCGKGEIDATFKFYEIDKNDLTYIGKLKGANTVAYTEKGKTDLCLYKVQKNAYSYGVVKLDDKGKLMLNVIKEGTAKSVKELPKLPGMKINFFKNTDLSGIADFDHPAEQ